jgi:hypothetical protein
MARATIRPMGDVVCIAIPRTVAPYSALGVHRSKSHKCCIAPSLLSNERPIRKTPVIEMVAGVSGTSPNRVVATANEPPAAIRVSGPSCAGCRFAQSGNTYKLRPSAASKNRGNVRE